MDPFTSFLAENLTRIVVIIVLLFFGKAILKLLVDKMKRAANDHNDHSRTDMEKRAETLGSIITTTGNIVIYALVLLMLLDIFGIDIRPILAGAGILGLAIGFGAQSLVKDFVSGLFILLENQYSVGDKVKIGGVEGEVERISIRSTVLRGKDSQFIYFSNGNIASKEVENLSQEDVSRGYGSEATKDPDS